MTSPSFRALLRHQLDTQLSAEARLRETVTPSVGWIASIRQALGMNLRQLANRLGVSPQAVAVLENGERRGSISVTSLRKVAEALDCDLIVALVPRRSLGAMVEQRAHEMTLETRRRVEHTMGLEGQAGDTDSAFTVHGRIADDQWTNALLKRLWD